MYIANLVQKLAFLGAFAKLRKATISFMSVRPCMSVRMEPGSHWTDFDEIWYLRLFRKSVEKTQVSLQSDNNNGHIHKDVFTFMTTSRWILLRMRNVSNKSCRKNQNTCFMFSGFFPENRAVWDNVEQYDADREIRQYGACAWHTG